MKSARLAAFTDRPDDIRIEDVAVPEPGPGQVRVRMLLAPVNPSDLNFVRGTYYRALERVVWNQDRAPGDETVYFDAARTAPCPLPPYALGLEGVGIVDRCGSGWLARRLQGRRVAVGAGPPHGTWQEFTIVDARRAVAVPAGLADEQAAMYLANPISAYVMVHEILRVPRDAWVLLTAAGSALAKSVVRLGRRQGFRTLCVVRSGANSAELMALGADAVVETNSRDPLREVARITGGRGVEFGLDCVGGDLGAQAVRCLGPGGHLIVYGTLADAPMCIQSRDLMMPMSTVSGFFLGHWMAEQSPVRLLAVLRVVRKLALEGVFHSPVTETYPLEEVSRAVSAAIAPGRTGKVMLRIGTR